MKEELNKKYSDLKLSLDKLWEEAQKESQKTEQEFSSQIESLKNESEHYKQKYEEAQSKITHIENQLENTVSKLEDISKDQKKDIDALQLLDIYLVLMGEVFSAAAHVRILFILHGEKDIYHLDELVKASGYPGLKVKQTIHELRNANVITFNEDTNEVTLVQRFM
ncbi:MAG: hypothetical protein INQ03_05760 [Candidatus Heimdallarchaeota archaeon]|nr:hypothetical protein [Candidatus Heimdallarchaeota archaeon]